MRLSILMPTHERPETLGFAIDSVRRQSFKDWELLVCGDGCGPETDRVVRAACTCAIEIFAAEAETRWMAAEKSIRKLENQTTRDKATIATLKTASKSKPPRRKWWQFFR